MRGKIIFVNEVISAIAYLKAAQNYLNDLPYHTLFIYETLGMHGFDKANELVIEILKEYGTISSKIKSIKHLDICPETNHDASMILYDAQQNVDYLLGILNQLKKEEKKLLDRN
ncbi:hypothetical protein SAMN05446037_101456 [Anaerovirgula multivorans]|uniref:Uncharacterized protein n=1 Tax=Anaerovirgula multivorans TaxID=312168 RepID=A0A239FV95_9FIRM|nr:hypothetical protein [Anaerovirgula multivorans]SNS60769.1 hypothetical protein SAMN05446037_101456 [Anaerovirgula multivorans]